VPPITPARNAGRVYTVMVSRSRKAFEGVGIQARNDVAVACDDYRAVLRNEKPGTKVKLVNTATGKTLASHTVVKK
jgi:hypothetical protein